MLDTCTRECLALEAGVSIQGADVAVSVVAITARVSHRTDVTDPAVSRLPARGAETPEPSRIAAFSTWAAHTR